jgi:hypothetical protein
MLKLVIHLATEPHRQHCVLAYLQYLLYVLFIMELTQELNGVLGIYLFGRLSDISRQSKIRDVKVLLHYDYY